MAFPVPGNESLRLRLLAQHRILDSAAETAFDDLARLASQLCGTPMAAITLIDAKRQWLKSAVGPLEREGPREHAFCTHALDRTDLLIVEDATADVRFAGNPSVLGPPGIRFYAGAPLTVAEGVTRNWSCGARSTISPTRNTCCRCARGAATCAGTTAPGCPCMNS